MKILVLQLARFGDIYQSWPALRALRRSHPHAQIDLIVRERFRDATLGLGNDINVIAYPTTHFLRPLVVDKSVNNIEQSYDALAEWMRPLESAQYDLIINLSFSPLSSYMTSALRHKNTEVRGYTRHADGHFQAVDDTSAYFYAQVGIGKANRYHLTQIFAAVCGSDLTQDDWGWSGAPTEMQVNAPSKPYVVFHVGASDLQKAYSSFKITQAIKRIEAETDLNIVLIGAKNEIEIGDQILSGSGLKRTTNLIGQTQLAELFPLIEGAQLVVGPDSAPIHVAAHTGTRVLNLSFDNVNFWETGPTSRGSVVLVAESPEALPSDQVAKAIQDMVAGDVPQDSWERDSNLGEYHYIGRNLPEVDFRWQLVQALYTGTPFPITEDKNILLSFKRLLELCELSLTEMERATDGKLQPTSLQILNHVDSLIEEIPRLVPEVAPVVDWFQTERIRIAPGSSETLLRANQKAFHDFHTVLLVYSDEVPLTELRQQSLDTCQKLANSLMDWDVKSASSELNEFLEMCRSMARISPKVGDSELVWSEVLKNVESGFINKDYLRLADLIKHEISPALENWVS